MWLSESKEKICKEEEGYLERMFLFKQRSEVNGISYLQGLTREDTQ